MNAGRRARGRRAFVGPCFARLAGSVARVEVGTANGLKRIRGRRCGIVGVDEWLQCGLIQSDENHGANYNVSRDDVVDSNAATLAVTVLVETESPRGTLAFDGEERTG